MRQDVTGHRATETINSAMGSCQELKAPAWWEKIDSSVFAHFVGKNTASNSRVSLIPTLALPRFYLVTLVGGVEMAWLSAGKASRRLTMVATAMKVTLPILASSIVKV